MIDTPFRCSHSGLSILIVDDNKPTLDLLRKTLMSYGISHVSLAMSGEDALRQLSIGGFDIVICDVVMDGMSGIHFVRTVRCKFFPNSSARVPIIMLSAHADEALVLASMKAGADAYQVKPLNPARLMQLIADLCHSTMPALRPHAHHQGV